MYLVGPYSVLLSVYNLLQLIIQLFTLVAKG